MKKILLIAMCAALFACSKDEFQELEFSRDKLIGTWILDYTCTYDQFSELPNFEYALNPTSGTFKSGKIKSNGLTSLIFESNSICGLTYKSPEYEKTISYIITKNGINEDVSNPCSEDNRIFLKSYQKLFENYLILCEKTHNDPIFTDKGTLYPFKFYIYKKEAAN
jgi:hypothetical protein